MVTSSVFHRHYVGPGEVVAFEKKWLSRMFGQSV